MNKTMITIFQRYRITEFGHQNRNITNEQLINIINLIEQNYKENEYIINVVGMQDEILHIDYSKFKNIELCTDINKMIEVFCNTDYYIGSNSGLSEFAIERCVKKKCKCTTIFNNDDITKYMIKI